MIHPRALLASTASIGGGTNVWAFALIADDAEIGCDCTIGSYVHVGPKVVVGDRCKIQNGAQLFEGVTLEDDVFIGPHVVFTNVLTPRAFVNRKAAFVPTLIKRGASIGANATIRCGITIGEYAMIGAGSVVTRDVGPYETWYGVPAVIEGHVCKCGERLPFRSINFAPDQQTCRCGNTYRYQPHQTPRIVVVKEA